MATKIIQVFFSLAFWSILGPVLSQTRASQIICSVTLEQNEGSVDCYTFKRVGEQVVSADYLRQLNVSDDLGKTVYLLSEYPHPITSFGMSIAAGIRIKEDALKALPKLTSLYLESYQGAITIPSEELKNTPDLKRLTVRRCTIAESTLRAIRSAPKLEYLKFRDTKGGKLKSDSLRGLVKLNILELTYSGFSTIEEGTFDGLTELTELELDGNNISSITTSLPKDSSKLKNLQFYDNAISTIPKSAFARYPYKQLTEMSLSKNPITKLENGVFEGLENLVHLYLTECPIDQLPESVFQKMTKLEVLSLDETMISKVNSTTFKGLRKLVILNLRDCKVLTTIEPGSFDDLVSVRSLYLKGNPNLKELPDGLFKNMKMLRYVNLVGTCVQNLSRANFTDCPNFDSLDMRDCVAGSNGTSR